MATIQRSALVNFSTKQMYDLVNDVESYPQFLPGCVGGQLLTLENNEMTATVTVAKAGIRGEFTTHNIMHPYHKIEIRLVKGPFKSLSGMWHFTELDTNACKVVLDLEFEFSNRLVSMAFGRIFKELAGAMVQAFCQRAKQVYTL